MNFIPVIVSSRTLIDKRRPHLIDIYYVVSPNSCERVATYSTKTKRLTFYDFPYNYERLWGFVDFFNRTFPMVLERIKENDNIKR